MNFIKISIQTFDSNLDYTGEFIDVTDDVDIRSVGKIKQKVDGSNFDVGIFRFTDFKFTLRNDHGKYSEPGVLQSIFTDKRIDSIVKVEWSQNEFGPICGIAICGEDTLGDDVSTFYGLLNDSSSTQNIRDNKITFSVQGLESIFNKVETNFSALSGTEVISDIIFDVLNQSGVTRLMTVDAGNISCDIDQVPDTIADLEETTIKEALDILLEASNSILYVTPDTQTVFVKARNPTASVVRTFYGQSSNVGSEDIVDLKKISQGINRTFNFLKWEDTTITSKDNSSIDIYGVRKKDIDNNLITDTTKRQNVLDAYKNEFAFPKRELMLTSILDYSTVELFFMDRIAIDYPTVFYPATLSDDIPRYGLGIYGQDKYPLGTWSLTITPETNFKIIGRTIDLKKGIVEFSIREI